MQSADRDADKLAARVRTAVADVVGKQADIGLDVITDGAIGKPSFIARIAALNAVRQVFPFLRTGRQYLRQISSFAAPFTFPPGGELTAWSRLLDDEETLCVVNGHGTADRGGQVVVDAGLNRGANTVFEVLANTAQTAQTAGLGGPHAVGQRLVVGFRGPTAFVQIEPIAPSEVLVLVNRPGAGIDERAGGL